MKYRPAKITGYEVSGDGLIFTISCVRLYGQLIFRCPFCGDVHYHGACGDDFGSGDGHRTAHCQGEKSILNAKGYRIMESKEAKNAGEFNKKQTKEIENFQLGLNWRG